MKVSKEEARHYLTEYVRSITPKSKGNQYVCPLCGSGTGKNKTGAFSIEDNGTNWKCFSCGEGGDVFDLVGKMNHLEGYRDQLKWLENWKSVSIESDKTNETAPRQVPKSQPKDYTKYFLEANRRLKDTDYHRGISMETLDRFNVGYDPSWRHEKAPEYVKATPRLIIPTSSESYIARDTREQIPESQKQYAKSKTGSVHIFNMENAKRSTQPVFIVEGELDALSIIDVGGEAIALGSTSMVNGFLENANYFDTDFFIIALDNDEAGTKAKEQLAAGLKERHIHYWDKNPVIGYKDANEMLQANRQGLQANVEQIYESIRKAQLEQEEAEREAYRKSSAENYLEEFQKEVRDSANRNIYATGFQRLDYLLDGGLYEGLYIIGAISSLGKTTLVMQIADQVAKQGCDVLYFTLEMSRMRIMARSISRHTAEYCLDNGNMANAKTARGVMDGRRYAGYTDLYGKEHAAYSDAERLTIKEAMKSYAEYAGHLYIIEGNGELDADDVERRIEQHIHFTGRTPLVIIDYLQILAPHDPKASDKQNTDYTVRALAKMIRLYRLPIIAISSFNRSNYNESVSMAAFKESGLIEYGADVLIGLQFQGAGTKDFDVDKAKSRDPREVELIILKNRDGQTGSKDYFNYYPKFNLFREPEAPTFDNYVIDRD